jgi:hypothetical protein
VLLPVREVADPTRAVVIGLDAFDTDLALGMVADGRFAAWPPRASAR